MLVGTAWRRARLVAAAATIAASLLGGCREAETGPITISTIGGPPRLVNPNLTPLGPTTAFVAESVAQGLVRFDANGEIEPALAQSWIVSDDGRRYTFRIRRTDWTGGGRVTAEQVASRLRASISRASRNRLKPVLGTIESVVAMTDEVLEISVRGPRPNLLHLLAQPELAIIYRRSGTGPYQLAEGAAGAVRLMLPRNEEDEESEAGPAPPIDLRGERAALAVARFAAEEADLVLGGTFGDLDYARAADLSGNRLSFDPVRGLFGLTFATADGAIGDPAIRRALSMAIDREGLVAAFNVPGMEPRMAIVPPGVEELPRPMNPDWSPGALPMRRQAAAQAIAALESPLRIRVAMPDAPGYRRLFARLRRDWRLIGVEADLVAPDARAELRLVDEIAPTQLASWYLRHFTCEAGPVCDQAADTALEAARSAASPRLRQLELAKADAILTGMTAFIPLTTPVRWSLVSSRLTGFRPNMFARHPAGTLIVQAN